MKELKVGINVRSMGTRCGINTYSMRLKKYLEEMETDKNGNDVYVEAKLFAEELKDFTADIISVQYEPGLYQGGPNDFAKIFDMFKQPIVVTAHHMGYLPQFYGGIDGLVIHAEDQAKQKPWDYTVIPHPALVFEDKDKTRMRKKWKLPLDKKIVGTSGFITGTGKNLPVTVEHILKNMNDDEFLYLITSMWKGGDFGRKKQIYDVVKKLGKEKQFRIDTDFVTADKMNEKMQACDLLYAWCAVGPNDEGSQSGSAADMYGSRTKLIVKSSAHYSFIGKQDKVLVGGVSEEEFAGDVLTSLREEDLEDVQDPMWLSWQEKIKDYYDYFLHVLGE